MDVFGATLTGGFCDVLMTNLIWYFIEICFLSPLVSYYILVFVLYLHHWVSHTGGGCSLLMQYQLGEIYISCG